MVVEDGELPPGISEDEKQRVLWKKLGNAGTFFAAVMSAAHKLNIIVFVATSNRHVASFLYGLNSGKACSFKQMTDYDNFTCQEFEWSEQKHEEFLRIRAKQKKLVVPDDDIVILAKESFIANDSVRQMDFDLRNIGPAMPHGVSQEPDKDVFESYAFLPECKML
jgi:hypothetical protein